MFDPKQLRHLTNALQDHARALQDLADEYRDHARRERSDDALKRLVSLADNCETAAQMITQQIKGMRHGLKP